MFMINAKDWGERDEDAEVDVWSDKKRQNQERTHPRNDESSAGVQKDNGEKTEMVWARHEDGGRSRSEESDDESDTGEKEERETKDKVEGCVQEGHADCRTERGRWRRQGLLERDHQQP